MLSIETTKKLREAGLCWEPQVGDCFYDISCCGNKVKHVRKYAPEYKLIYTWEYFEDYLRKEKGFRLDKVSLKDAVFAPRLDQSVAKAQELGYWMVINTRGHIIVGKGGIGGPQARFDDEQIDEAVAQALLWILQNK